MKVHWVRSKSLIFALFLLVGFFSSTACYEKRPRNQGNDKAGPRKPGDGGGGSDQKIFGLAIVDIIVASPEAMTDRHCGNIASSLREVRQLETELRIRSLALVIEQMAEMNYVRQLQISPEDCGRFAGLEKLSRDSMLPVYPDALFQKPSLHLRVVIWPGDTSPYSPAPDVIRERWAIVQSLESRGARRTLSLNYFAITEPEWGYILRWMYMLRDDLRFIAPVMNIPAPTPEAVDSIQQNVRLSTEEFRLWLLERASQP